MSNSALATYTLISPNRNSPRNHAIDRVTVHCFVGQVTAARGCAVFQPTSKQASCNYVVGCDGSIGLCVEEKTVLGAVPAGRTTTGQSQSRLQVTPWSRTASPTLRIGHYLTC